MTAVLTSTAPSREEGTQERLLLYDVSWRTYEDLLEDYRDKSAPRLTYDRGTLEIMSPLPQHERLNRRLSQLVLLLTEEWGIEAEDLGSVTLKRSDLGRGFEPDSCFYITHATQMRGREAIDLEGGDPAPDLVIEIDVTSPSLPKLPLYAAVGVAEIWRVSPQGIFMILIRKNNDYEEREASQALPTLTVAAVTDLMTRYEQAGRLEWVRQVREWARQNTPAEA